MPKRNSHGLGTVYSRTSATGRRTWHAELMTGYAPDGKRRVWRSPTCKTKREAQSLLDDAREANRKGQLTVSSRVTLTDYLQAWLADVAKPNVSERTYLGYASHVRQHIAPHLGCVKLGQLTPARLQSFWRELLDAGLSPTTVRKVHATIHNALEAAVSLEILPRNPASKTKPPKAPRQERPTLSLEQAKALLAAVRDDPLEALYVLTLTTGLRQGEVLALHWGDWDQHANRLSVRRSVTRVTGQPLKEKSTKTERPRVVPVFAVAAEALRRQRVRQAEQQLAAPMWQDSGLIFTNSVGKAIDPRNLLPRSWYPLRDRLGLGKMRFHDLRHSAASLMLGIGVPVRDVMAILGHASIKMTADTYGHVIVGLQNESLRRWEDALQ